MYTLSALIKQTPTNIRKNAKNVRSMLIRSIHDTDVSGAPIRKAIFKARDSQTKRKPKLITFRIYGNYKQVVRNEIWVHCSCEYFLFNLEYALTTQNSSSVINSNGQYPIEKNPNLYGHACKHILASVPALRAAKFVKPRKVTKLDLLYQNREVDQVIPKK